MGPGDGLKQGQLFWTNNLKRQATMLIVSSLSDAGGAEHTKSWVHSSGGTFQNETAFIADRCATCYNR